MKGNGKEKLTKKKQREGKRERKREAVYQKEKTFPKARRNHRPKGTSFWGRERGLKPWKCQDRGGDHRAVGG